jgi:hypothetical protein
MFRDQSQIGFKGGQRLHCVERTGAGSSEACDPPFLLRDDLLCAPHATLGKCEEILVRHDARNEYGSVAASARKCARQLNAAYLNHGQVVEATLIGAEAIG